MDYDVPFFPNTSDDSHCVQASYKMILNYFQPDKDYSFDELDTVTGKLPHGGTWAALGHIWMVKQGFDIEYWTLLDWKKFVEDGYEYILNRFGKEVADWQAENSDIRLEQKRAREALKAVPTFMKEPRVADIISFLDRGYLVKCTVNSSKLNDKEGYAGHLVVVKGYTNTALLIHDPGPPPLRDRVVLFADFESAWAYPNKSAKELTAIKLKQPLA